MLRRSFAGALILSLFLFAVTGCGSSGGAETPKVENPSVKIKAITPKSKPGDGTGVNAY